MLPAGKSKRPREREKGKRSANQLARVCRELRKIRDRACVTRPAVPVAQQPGQRVGTRGAMDGLA